MHHTDRLIADRMKEYSQTPSDRIWLMIENKLDAEDGQAPEKRVSKKLLEELRITHS